MANLGYIADLKELTPQAYKPMILAEIALYNQGAPAIETIRLASALLAGTSEGGGGFPFGAGQGSGANITYTTTGGAITGYSIVSGGSNYVNPPALSAPGGSGANLVATVVAGVITAVTIVAGGTGYSNGSLTVTAVGFDYMPRLLKSDIALTQALSDQGIDYTPSISLIVNDPDGTIWNDFEAPIGFKGALMTIRFVFWQAGTGNFSTDSVVKFVGICQQAEIVDDTTIRITAVSKLQMNQTMLPSIRVQPTCPWIYPQTPAQRQFAADSDASPSFECGYSPDATGSNARGNYQGTTTLASPIPNGTTLLIGTNPVTGSLPAFPFPAIIGSTGEVVIVESNSGGLWTLSQRGAQGTIGQAASSLDPIYIPYPSCGRTRADCMLRLGKPTDTSFSPDGNITEDLSNRTTGRFGGVQWDPPGIVESRGYISGKWEEIVNNSNQAKYGDLVPLPYGTTWVNALVLNVTGDANYTKMEVLLCHGQIPFVYDVIVNGVKIPHTSGDSRMSAVPNELSGNHLAGGFWGCVNDGRRDGNLNADSLYDKKGDPYGSLAVLEVVVPVQLAAANSVPSVQVRIDGPQIRVYTDPNTYSLTYSSNPAWVMFDVLLWAGWQPSDINIASFIAAAAKFDTQMYFISQTGANINSYTSERPGVGTVPYKKWDVSMTVRQRTSAADILRGLRAGSLSLLLPNDDDGTITLQAKETLASQQPSLPTLNGHTSTNYTTAIPSDLVDATVSSGYAAYSFDESNIAKKSDGSSTFRVLPQSISDSPNSTSASFQDFENKYTIDSLTLDDTEDQIRIATQPIVGSAPLYGLSSFDRARRAMSTWQAENHRGNARSAIDGQTIGDTGGTVTIEFETSFRAIHLHVGHLIRVSWAQRNMSGWLFRVKGVQPGSNAERIKITASYHNDGWYLNTFGQVNAPPYKNPQGNDLRLPYCWCPFGEQPVQGDSIFPRSEWSFQLSQEYITLADGTFVPRAICVGRQPVNQAAPSPRPPLLTLQATTSSTGGSIPGGRTYWIMICSKNVSGGTYKPSFPSFITSQVFVPSGTNTNRITVAIPLWDLAALGYVVFAGTSPQKLSYQIDGDFSSGSGPSTITLSAYNEAAWGVPDSVYQDVTISPRNLDKAGVATYQVVSATSTTIQVDSDPSEGFGMTTNQFAGYDISIVCLVRSVDEALFGANAVAAQGPIPIFNAKIASNTADTFTLAAGLDGNIPDPTAFPRGDGTFGLIGADFVTIRSKPTAVGEDSTGKYIEDSNWINNANGLFAGIPISNITNANPGVVTTVDPHGFSTGNRVAITDLTGVSPALPHLTTITVIDAHNFSIGIDTTSSSAYISGGLATLLLDGLGVNTFQGDQIVIYAGSGKYSVMNIASHTATRIYIAESDWPNGTPDSTTRYWIAQPVWQPSTTSEPASNTDINSTLTIKAELNNYSFFPIMVLAETENGFKQQSLYAGSPMRDFLLMGNPNAMNVYEKATFGIPGDLTVGNDQTAHYNVKRSGTLFDVTANLKGAATGSGVTYDILFSPDKVTWTSIFPAGHRPTIPAGTVISVISTTFANAPANMMTAGGYLRIDVTAIGSINPGAWLEVVARWPVNVNVTTP